MATQSLYQTGNIHSDYTDYVRDTYGRVDADLVNTGMLVSSVGRLGIYPTGGDLNIEPQASTGDIVIASGALTGAVNIGTSGTRTITIGSSTGELHLAGPVIHLDDTVTIDKMSAPIALANATENITATQLMEPNVLFTCNNINCAFTLPTAADIVAGYTGCSVGSGIIFTILQYTGNTTTVTANTNVTLATGNLMTVPSGTSGKFLIYLTNIGSGTEAATVYRIA